MPTKNIVTGAFGYTGKYITRRLLERGEEVATLTGHPDRPNPDHLRILPFDFAHPEQLAEHLRDTDVLYNTYWVRFNYGQTSYDQAVQNTLTLFRAAKQAGVKRVVHVSITNPSEDSPLPYFHGKAVLERALRESGLSYAILRPTVIFGREDILINNIAWFLRRFPAMAVPGDGSYPLQPIYVEDMADLAVQAGHDNANVTLDAVGPESLTFRDLLVLIAHAVGSRAVLVNLPPALVLGLTNVFSLVLKDVVLTREEILGLMAGLLVSSAPPTGSTRLSQWLARNADQVGRTYASELARHYVRNPS